MRCTARSPPRCASCGSCAGRGRRDSSASSRSPTCTSSSTCRRSPYRVLDAADAAWRSLGPAFCSGLRSRFVVSEAPDPIVNAGAVVRADGLPLLGLDPGALASGVTSQPWFDGPARARARCGGRHGARRDRGGAHRAAAVEPRSRRRRARRDRTTRRRPLAADRAARGRRRPAASGVRGAVQAGDGLDAQAVRGARAVPSPDRSHARCRGVAAWSELAADGGYYDQSHVIRDFKRFSGYTPAEYHRRVSAAGPDAVRFVPDPEAAFR